MNKIQILDVTLRDGEQTNGVSFSSVEKLNIAKSLLEKLSVDRIEIASARVSNMEFETSKLILDWAKERNLEEKVEILGFVDKKKSVDWISEVGGKFINLLTKGSLHHLDKQLKKNLKEHLNDIEENISYAFSKNIKVNVYLEDWSNGFKNSPEYVSELLKNLVSFKVEKIYLADTLGILSPDEVYREISNVVSHFPNTHFEFHGHNDYGLSVANCLYAVKAGVKGLHLSINGLGERAGNSPLESVIAALHDKTEIKTKIQENKITEISNLVEVFSGKKIAANRPIVGEDVFTQTAGVHADGDEKANLYASLILPERFGRKRVYALGKLAGKASISQNLKELGLILSKDLEKKVLQRVIELGEQKKIITAEDLPFIIADLSEKSFDFTAKILSCDVHIAIGLTPKAKLKVLYKNEEYEGEGEGDGGYDAFMNGLRKIFSTLNINLPKLKNYHLRIPPGGKTDALVEVVTVWKETSSSPLIKTTGLHSDQVIAAVTATEKMLNLFLK